MPKINVYLPEDLAAAVKAANIPVSPVCQKALAEAVRTVTTVRKGIEAIRDPDLDASKLSQIAGRLDERMTARLREALHLAQMAAGPSADVQTRHLLLGILDEGDNLAVRLLRAADHDPDELREAATSVAVEEAATGASDELWGALTMPARAAIGAALEAALELAHNYLGCEHLLLGLLDDPDSAAGRALTGLGIEAAEVRRSLTAALAGFAHARQASPPPATPVDEVLARLDAIERRLTTAGL